MYNSAYLTICILIISGYIFRVYNIVKYVYFSSFNYSKKVFPIFILFMLQFKVNRTNSILIIYYRVFMPPLFWIEYLLLSILDSIVLVRNLLFKMRSLLFVTSWGEMCLFSYNFMFQGIFYHRIYVICIRPIVSLAIVNIFNQVV